MSEFLKLLKMELPFRRWRGFYLMLLGVLAVFTYWSYGQVQYNSAMITTVILTVYFVAFFRLMSFTGINREKPQVPGNVFHRILPVKPWKMFLAHFLAGLLIFLVLDFLAAVIIGVRYGFRWPTWQPLLLLLYANVVYISLMINYEMRNARAFFFYLFLFLLLYMPPVTVGIQRYWESVQLFSWWGFGVAGLLVSLNCYLFWKCAIFGKRIPFLLQLFNVVVIAAVWGLAAWLFWKGTPPHWGENVMNQGIVVKENKNDR